MNLVAGINNAIKINPTLVYSSSTIFQWEEDFESGLTFNSTSFSDTTINQTAPNPDPCTCPACPCSSDPKVFEGTYSGVIDLDAAHPYFSGETQNSYYLPSGSDPVFLEMNYKANQSFDVGIYANSTTNIQPIDIMTINASNTWNKIYINLNTAVNSNTINANLYQVYIQVTKSDTVAYPEILLDNLKLIYL
jgi:hypothetical protein